MIKPTKEKEEEKEFTAMLYGFSGFAIGCVWIILLVGLWGGKWVESYDSEMGEIGLDFLLNGKIFIVTGIVWAVLIISFIYNFSKKNKNKHARDK